MKPLNLGHVQVASGALAHVNERAGDGVVSARTRVVSMEEAQRSSGFKMLQPKWIPTGLQPSRVLQLVNVSSPAGEVVGVFQLYRESPARWVLVQQVKLTTSRLTVAADIVGGTVGGRPAVLFSCAMPGRSQPNSLLVTDNCYWEDGDFLMSLQARGLSQGELIRMAESLV